MGKISLETVKSISSGIGYSFDKKGKTQSAKSTIFFPDIDLVSGAEETYRKRQKANYDALVYSLSPSDSWQTQDEIDQHIDRVKKRSEIDFTNKANYDSLIDILNKRKEVYGQFETADAYNAAVERGKLQEKFSGLSFDEKEKRLEELKQWSGPYDLDTKAKEIEYLENYALGVGYSTSAEYQKEIDSLNASIEQINRHIEFLAKNVIPDSAPGLTDAQIEAENAKNSQEIARARSNAQRLKLQVRELERNMNELKGEEFSKETISDLQARDDFEEKANLNSQAQDPWYFRMFGVNEDDRALLNMLEEDEKKALYYLGNTEGERSAREFFERLRPTLNKRAHKYDQDMASSFAESAPIISNIVSVGTNLVSGFQAPIKFVLAGTDNYEKNWASLDQMSTYTSKIRETTLENIDSDVGKFVYSLGMSTVDMVAAWAIAKGVGKAFGAAGASAETIQKAASGTMNGIMASESASSAMTEAHERGLEWYQIAAIGFGAAAAEVLSEKYAADSLFDESTKGLKRWVITSLSESGSEVSSNVLNTLWDGLVAGNEAVIAKRIQELMDTGLTRQQAAQQVFTEKAKELGNDALAGLFMGAFVGGTDLIIDKATTVRYSVPDKFSNDLGSAQTWVAEKLLNQKTVVKVKGLGDVAIDHKAMNEAVSSVKTKDRALMFLALNDTLRKGAVATAESSPNNANSASIIAPVYLNGNMHMAEVKVTKVADGQYTVNGITLDGETIYDASTYAKPVQDTAAENGEVTAKLVGGNKQADGGFDYQEVAKISQSSVSVEDSEFDTANQDGKAWGKKTYINMEDFSNNDSPVWRNVDYDNDLEKSKITRETHEEMIRRGDIVIVSDDVRGRVEKSFPDLRSMKRKERKALLKETINKLKEDIRGFLKGLKEHGFEFEVSGRILEARLYSTGIREVVDNITKEKANMLFASKEIFQNARYMYSVPDYGSDSNVYRWNYFYSPVQIGEDIVGVRIAVRDLIEGQNHLPESQIYHWGIKKDTSLGGVQPVISDSSHGASSDVSKVILPNFSETVKGDETNSDPDVLESRSYDYTESAENWTAERLNDGSDGKLLSAADIVTDIEKTFGVPINKGNIQQKKAAGIFKSKVNAIRTQLGNALPTICHEIGHLLDKNYKLSSLPSVGEAVDVMQKRNPQFAALYAEHQQKGEAIAEFVREYMRDRAEAKERYPQFFNAFINAIGKDLGKMNAVSDKVNAYMYSSVSERLAANTTNRTDARRKKGSASERLKGMAKKELDWFADDVGRIEEVSDRAYRAVYNARKSATVAEFVIGEGMVDINGNYVEGWENIGLARVLAPVIESKSGKAGKVVERLTGQHNNDYDAFRTYLTLKRGLDLIGMDVPMFNNGDSTLKDPAKIQQEIDKLEAQYPSFKETADQLYAWQRQFYQTWYVETGMMTQEAYDALWEKHPHYVPFNRNIKQEISRRSSSKNANQDTDIKKIHGGSEELFDPIENIVVRAALTVEKGKRNRVMQMLALEVENGTIDSTILEKISTTRADAINEALDKQPLVGDSGTVDTASDPIESIDIVEWTGRKTGENVVWAVINGERVLYEVHDEAFLKALLDSTPNQAGIITSVLSKFGGAFKSMTTGANLIWSITSNSFRDYRTGYLYGSEGNPLKYARDYGKAFVDVAFKRQAYRDAQAAGLGYTSRIAQPKQLARVMQQLGQNTQGRRVLRNAFSSMIEGIQAISEVVEATPRMAEYSRAIKQGKSKTDAVYAASEVTLNFDRKGAVSKRVDLVYPFFNVQIQGLYKQASMIADPTTRMQFIRRKAVSSFITALFVLAANAALGGKDEYEKLSDYVKNNYYCIHIGGGRFIRIPKARELDVLESAFERLGEVLLYGNDADDSFNDFAEYVFQSYAPLGFPDITALFNETGKDKLVDFIKPTFTDMLIVGSFAEAAMNENYSGGPIVPAQYEGLVAKEQYDNKTSAVAKWLGSITGMSPMKLDHLMVSNTGFVGKLIKAWTAADVDWTGGYGNQFTTDVAYSNEANNRFYDELEEAEMYANTYPDDPEYQSSYKQYTSASSVLSYCYRKARENPDMEREYRMMALSYAEEFLDGGVAQNEKLDAIYEATKEKAVYPYRKFEDTYTKSEKDAKGNTVKTEVTMTSKEYFEYVNTYNATIDTVYGEILDGITDKKIAAVALQRAKDEINEYAQRGEMTNVMIAREAGVSADRYYTIKLTASTDGNSNIKKEEAVAALDKSNLTNKQKAIIFDLLGDWKSNPYKYRYY